MAFKTRESIVTNGLIAHLDAANPASYTSGSNDWYNLLAPTPTGSLNNGIIFSSEGRGSLQTPGGSGAIIINTSVGTTRTVQMTFKPIAGSGNARLIDTTGFIALNNNTCNLYFPVTDFLTSIFSFSTGFNTLVFQNDVANNVMKIWNNGELKYTNIAETNATYLKPVFWISQRAGFIGEATQIYCANFSVYNRILTPDEILQNYRVVRRS